MRKLFLFILLFLVTAQHGYGSERMISVHSFALSENLQKKFCYQTYLGKYVITLHDDGSKIALYQLYDIQSGALKKTMKGTWTLRDEGIYGPAPTITLTWTGVNQGMVDLKFTAQYDGYGKLQGLIDLQNRIWSSCSY
jgi:hypothetical protein